MKTCLQTKHWAVADDGSKIIRIAVQRVSCHRPHFPPVRRGGASCEGVWGRGGEGCHTFPNSLRSQVAIELLVDLGYIARTTALLPTR